MAAHGSSWLLQAYVLLMLARPLGPSSHPERDMGTSGEIPEDMEQQDMGPATTPLWVMVAVSLAGFILELLLTGIVLRWCLGRRLWKCWGELREGCQAGGMGAGAGRKRGLWTCLCQARHESPCGGEKLGRSQGSWSSWAALCPRPQGRGGVRAWMGIGPCS